MTRRVYSHTILNAIQYYINLIIPVFLIGSFKGRVIGPCLPLFADAVGKR